MSNKNFRALSFCFVATLIIALLIGCAAKKPFWGDEKTGFILSYKLANDQTWKYQSATKQTTSQEVMGQLIEVSTDIATQYSLQGAGLDKQKNLVTRVKMDTISFFSSSMQGETRLDLSAIIGKDFGLTLTPKGRKVAFSNPDSIKIEFGQMMGGKQDIERFYRNLVPRLPEQPIKIGESWTVTEDEVVPQGGLSINVHHESQHTLEGVETIAGMECMKITAKTTGTLDGTGKQMGMDVNFEGDLEGTSTWYFAYKNGMFVQSASELFMEGTAAVSGQMNMTIPITQTTKSEAKLLK